jgi:hypothetical protein
MRFVVVQKPMQDIFTVVLFVTAIMVVVMAGAMTVTVLEESGMTLTRADADSANSPPKSMPVRESDSYNDCEVIYHQVSLHSEYAIIASETGQDPLPALYYAVYICTGSSVMATFSA